MTIADERHGDIAILRLAGTFVGKASVSLFERTVYDQLKDDVTKIILDLAELRYIDSAGLGAMISAMVSVGRRHGALRLAAPDGEVAKSMKSMHLHKVFAIYTTLQQAEKGF